MTIRNKKGPPIGSMLADGAKNQTGGSLGRWVAVFVLLTALVLWVSSLSHAEDRKVRVISFLSSGIRTAATAQTSTFDVSSYTEGQIFIDVTAKVGSPTLDITIQTSPDNVTWYTHTAMTQITTTGQYRQAITNFGNYVRINHVVGATTSYTYSITGVFKN